MQSLPVSLQVFAHAWAAWWDDWVNMVVVNLAWALCWITIVLGPPATFGLVYVTDRLVHGEAVGLPGLWQGMRRYWLKSWLWTSLNVCIGLILVSNLNFYGRLEASWALLLEWLMLFLAVVWGAVQFYTIPFLVEQAQERLPLALRNGLFTTLAAPGYTLVLLGIATSLAVISVFTLAPLLLGGPCLIAILASQAVVERLETYRVRER